MKRPVEHSEVATALSAALEPVIDVCLAIGITIPELEALIAAAFVERAVVKLPRHPRTQRAPGDSRISLVTGITRARVAQIRKAGSAEAIKQTIQHKEQLYSRSARVLTGWTTDPRFLTNAGLPLDLPLAGDRKRRSFKDLVKKYAPGLFAPSLLKELRRRGHVEVLEDDIVRFKTATPTVPGVTKANVAQAAGRVKRLGDTLFRGILEPEPAHLYAESAPLALSPEQSAAMRAVLERRATTFLAAVESEFRGRQAPSTDGTQGKIGVSVFSWQED